MVDISNLETQLTAKIAELTGKESLKELMALKLACDNTKVNVASLDAAIQKLVTELNDKSDVKELLAANRASKLSGADPTGVNSVAAFNETAKVLTRPDGSVWLRSGAVGIKPSDYPEAIARKGDGVYLREQAFPDIPNEDENRVLRMTFGGGFFWLAGHDTKKIHKLNPDFTYTGFSFSIQGPLNNVTAIAASNEFIWVCGSKTGGYHVAKFQHDGTHVGEPFSIASMNGGSSAMVHHDSHLWVAEALSARIHKLTESGAATGGVIDIAGLYGQNFINSLAIDSDNNIWTGYTSSSLRKTSMAGQGQGDVVNIAKQNAYAENSVYLNNSLYILDSRIDGVREYHVGEFVGLPKLATESGTNFSIYYRVK